MKKYGIFKVLLLMLALLLTVSTVASCALPLLLSGNDNPAEETNTTETTTVPEEDPEPEEPVDEGEFTVTVANGSINGGKKKFNAGETITLNALTPPNGYSFSHWENSKGEQVGLDKALDVTVTGDESYKAYYNVVVSSAFSGAILTDLVHDWQQGGIDANITKISIGSSADPSRVSLATPFLLKEGSTINVALPEEGPCNAALATNKPEPCTDGTCGLAVTLVEMTRNEGALTGDMLTDYSMGRALVKWASNGLTYTATEDMYIMITIKYFHGAVPLNIKDPNMSEVVVTYSAPKTEGANVLGSYWSEELDDTINKIQYHRGESSSYLSEFFYLTDTHWTGNAQYSPALINYIAEQVEAYNVVVGGDIIVKYSETKQFAIDKEINSFYGAIEGYSKVGEKLKIFTTLGNHDRNGSSNQPNVNDRLSEQEAYDLYLKRVEGWGVTTEGDPNHSYYDDTVNKVRYVQFYFAGSQYGMIEDKEVDDAMAWASEKILELDESWTVVLLTHGYFCDAEGGKNEVTPKSDEVGKKMLALKAEAKAEIAIWITGHNHHDRNVELVSADGETKLLLISMNRDAYTHSSTASYKMTLGTTTEQSFGFFQIDTLNKKIYMTRVGAGEDAVYSYGEPDEVVDDGKGSNVNDGKATIRVMSGTMADGKFEDRIEIGKEIILTAMDAPEGYHFVGWKNFKGDMIGYDKTIKVAVEANDVFTAVFAKIPLVDLTIVGGTFEDGTTALSTPAFEKITLIAGKGPDPVNFRFVCWKNKAGEIIGTEATMTIEAPQQNEEYTAVFDQITRPISFVKDGTFGDGSTAYISFEVGDKVTLIARPAKAGETFVRWVNSAGEPLPGGDKPICEVVTNQNDTYIAVFSVSNVVVAGGTLHTGLTNGTFTTGEEITLIPDADKDPFNYRVYWTNDAGYVVGTDWELTIKANGNMTYTAVYEEIHRVDTTIENGKITTGEFADKTEGKPEIGVAITLQANEVPYNFRFGYWENAAGEIIGTEMTITVIPTENDTVYKAVYVQHEAIAINGEFENGTNKIGVGMDEPTTITMKAVIAPRGYRFLCWKDAEGNVVSTDEVFTTTIDRESATFKAYYEVFFGEAAGEIILKDLTTEWQQGGFAGKFDAFNVGDKADPSRVSFAEPYALKAGQNINISLPEIECPFAGKSNACTNECVLTAGIMLLKKDGSTDGVIPGYTKLGNTTWSSGGYNYTATEDCYLMATVKYNTHGGEKFNLEMPAMKDVVITTIQSGEMLPVGNYWEAELADGIAKIEANRDKIGEDVSEFFYITDTHWTGNAQYSPALINYIAERVGEEHVIVGGDLIVRYSPTKDFAINEEIKSFYNAFEGYAEMGENLKIFTTLGNHDRNGSSNQPNKNDRLTEEEAYELYFKRLEGWGVTEEGNPNQSYYDDEINKVRYVQFYFAGSEHGMLEDSYVDDAMAWAEEKVKELDETWTVVLLTHGYFCGAKGAENEVTIKDSEVALRMLQLQKDAAAEIAIWITGHIHADRDEVLESADGETKLRLVSLHADAYTHGGSAMKFGTTTEQSFSFLQVDTKEQIIYLTRFGYGDDLVFEYGQDIEGTMTVYPPNDVAIINGETTDDKSFASVLVGSKLNVKADPAPAGYAFDCWKDQNGNVVGTTAECTIVLSEPKDCSFKACYKAVGDSDPGYANRWIQGALDGNANPAWCYDGKPRHSRVTLAEPIFLKKGQTITVTLPEIKCIKTPGDCPSVDGTGDCGLALVMMVCTKNEGVNTGDIARDYTMTKKVGWGFTTTYTADADVYVFVSLKYDKHGGDPLTIANEDLKKVEITVQ